MIKELVEPGIIRITLDDDRWYKVETDEGAIYHPAVTWTLNSYPKGYGYHQWLGNLPSFEESQVILHDAGRRGSKVHGGIERLLHRESLSIDDLVGDHTEPFTAKEWMYVMYFNAWYERYQPIIEAIEYTIINPEEGYGGTVDLRCLIDKGRFEKEPTFTGELERWLIDWKTSANIYESAKCQVAAYWKAEQMLGDIDRAGIVRLGSKHKVGYEFWQDDGNLEHYYELFLNTKKIWAHENPEPEPKFIDVPETLILEDYNAPEHEAPDIERPTGQDKDGDKSKKGKQRIPAVA